jgi:hypothetical protein
MSLAFELPIHADNLQAIGRYALPTPALQAA